MAHFDSTAKHSDWVDGEASAVQKLAPAST
jgi:hypothetical protein